MSTFKWQVCVNSPYTRIPCNRGVYNIGLSSLVMFNVPKDFDNSILYVCIHPYVEGGSIYLDQGGRFINSIKAVVNTFDTVLKLTFSKDEITFHKIDLSGDLFNLSVLNTQGDNVLSAGYAIFQLLPYNE